jgi:hypothetical protein
MTIRDPNRVFSWIALLAILLLQGCSDEPKPGQGVDEARLAGRAANTFKHSDAPYFHDMDGAVTLTTQEEAGRNMWLVWSGGNDRFWDQMTQYTYGGFDLLKIISSHPSQGYSRSNRWSYLGLVNEPCFDKATGPDPNRRGLWLDVRSKDCNPDPFEDESKYPGVALGARGKPLGDGTSQPIGSFYGYATGILGLRLFPNPAFDEQAAKDWKPDLYYTDSNYYNRKELVRPYRVGMSCGFCHVGPSPVNPPADPANPTLANLSSSVGAQYMWVDRLFIHNADKPEGQRNYMFQLAHTFRPGSMDTSLVSTDSINNPRTMNAVYDFVSRLRVGKRLWHEKLAGGELDNKQLNDFFPTGPLSEYYDKVNTIALTPHVLKDGADSVGLLGALNRVYLNIGVFSEEWLLHADQDRRCAKELVVLAGHRGWHAQHGAVLPQGGEARSPARCARWQCLPECRRSHLGSRQDRLRQYLRALPFEQGARTAGRPGARCRKVRRGRLPEMLQSLLELDADRRLQEEHARHRAGVRFPAGQLPLDRGTHPRNLAAYQCLQPAGDQRAGRQYLGQLFVPLVQGIAVGGHNHRQRSLYR